MKLKLTLIMNPTMNLRNLIVRLTVDLTMNNLLMSLRIETVF